MRDAQLPVRLAEDDHRTQKSVAIIPAHNEALYIGSVVLSVRDYVSAVVVVDDGSMDSTGKIAQAAGAILVSHEQNRGKGCALNSGFAKARSLGATIIVTLDGDGQHLPDQLELVMGPIRAGIADIVVGSRYLDNLSNVPTSRIWGHQFFNRLTRWFSGVNVSDSQSGYRAFSGRALELITFQSNGFSVEAEIQFVAREHDLSVQEVPITVLYHSRAKRSLIAHGLAVLSGLIHLAGQYRPLLVFSALGAFLTILSLLLGAWSIQLVQREGVHVVSYSLLSTMFIILGSIAFSTGLILHSVRALLIRLMSDSKS